MANEKAPRKVAISQTQVRKFAARLSSTKQRLDDVRMSNAQAWKEFEDAGGNKAAFKAVMKLKNQDAAKTADYQFHFEFYAEVLGLEIDPELFGEVEAEEDGDDSVAAE